MTDDDCTVAPSWVDIAWRRFRRIPTAIITGRVLPMARPLAVPSTIDEPTPRDYTGEIHYGALYGGNMACNRSLVLAAGGFDERLPVAEDNDFCYRWLRAGDRSATSLSLSSGTTLGERRQSGPSPPKLWPRAGPLLREAFPAARLRRRPVPRPRCLPRDSRNCSPGARETRRMARSLQGLLSGLLRGLVEGWRPCP